VGLLNALKRRVVPLSSTLILVALIPFQALLISKVFICGWELNGAVISLFVSFIILPVVFFVSFPSFYEGNIEFLKKSIKYAILFISSFGIFLFIYKYLTSNFIEIPYLTVNVDDMGQLESKNIDRGIIFKLISTYNNGNVYGICVLMLLPLFCLLERRYLSHLLVKFSLFLTFSRTVWVGLCLFEILEVTIFKLMKRSILRWVIDLSLILLFVFIFYFIGFNFGFLLDSEFGGRRAQLSLSPTFFSKEPLEVIGEMSYIGVLREFGLLGLLLFVVALFTPLFFLKGEMGKVSLFGALLYLFVSLSDGALELIPVMAFYWGLVSIGLINYNLVDENVSH